ncbi:unnamed protein product [Rhizoctonia solani]|uniref:Transmembrane protein n=1 Tax=Rhizoctonia solani TaxID=456999 RepID=A0A8H3EFR4_9AGAM|nr:unnamed protein product [Rhizoctonia solani]
MKLTGLLLAAPVVLTMVAADPRPTARPERRVLDRWRFARQDESSTAAGGGGGGGGATTTTPAASTPTREATSQSPTSAAPETTSTPQQQQPTSTSSPTSQQQQQPTSTSTPARPTSAATTSSTQQQQQSSQTQAPAASSTPAAPSVQTPTTTEFSLSTPPPSTAIVSTTDQSGRVITSVMVITQSPTAVAVSPTASAPAEDEKKGVSQSTVIGLAVTGSIAGLLIILLIVWKLTGKRFSDLEDNDDDAIKWPELHKDSAAMTPIPARPSARAAGGTETDTLGTDFDRQSAAAHSAADLSYPPYSDDPGSGYGARPAYYDPYGGAPGATKPYPSPPGSHDGDHKTWGGPADAQFYDAPRGPSPGPNAIARGMSPGPGVAYDNRVASPAPPNMAYADPVGRTGSPGPGGYGYGAYPADPYGGRNSPGPNMAYAQPEMDPYGRRSPGPGMVYNPGRVASPGPGAGAAGYR